jgi:hypothetical protein
LDNVATLRSVLAVCVCVGAYSTFIPSKRRHIIRSVRVASASGAVFEPDRLARSMGCGRKPIKYPGLIRRFGCRGGLVLRAGETAKGVGISDTLFAGEGRALGLALAQASLAACKKSTGSHPAGGKSGGNEHLKAANPNKRATLRALACRSSSPMAPLGAAPLELGNRSKIGRAGVPPRIRAARARTPLKRCFSHFWGIPEIARRKPKRPPPTAREDATFLRTLFHGKQCKPTRPPPPQRAVS